jgi:hypothetical protein
MFVAAGCGGFDGALDMKEKASYGGAEGFSLVNVKVVVAGAEEVDMKSKAFRGSDWA